MITPFGEPIDTLEDLGKGDWDGLKDWEGMFISFIAVFENES